MIKRLAFPRLAGLIAALSLFPTADASWTVTLLHPQGFQSSTVHAGYGSQQVGYGSGGGSGKGALLWSGTHASAVDLTPAGASTAVLRGTNGIKQVGMAYIAGAFNAGIWSGTAASFVNLTPAGMTPSAAYAIDGNQQVGRVTVGGNDHAALWTGTAASMVDLHPDGMSRSTAWAVGGGKQGGTARPTASSNDRAALWSGSAASHIDLHPTGFAGSAVWGMSAVDQVGAVLTNDSKYRASLWKGTAASRVDLHPTMGVDSYAYGSNGEYQAGYYVDTNSRAAVWKGTAASMIDLHQYVPAAYSSSAAYSIWSLDGAIHVGGYAFNETTRNTEACMWRMAGPNEFEFTLNKSQVAGQNSVQGTITAAIAIPQARVYTTYDNSSLVVTPASVTLAGNALVKNFQITTTAVNSTINTIVYAKLGTTTKSVPLALIPLVPTALAFTPSQVVGGNNVSCRVVINGVAGPSGRTIAILDNSPNAAAPATVTVPPGATQVTFNISTTPVTSLKTVTVTARVSAGEKTGTFRIAP